MADVDEKAKRGEGGEEEGGNGGEGEMPAA